MNLCSSLFLQKSWNGFLTVTGVVLGRVKKHRLHPQPVYLPELLLTLSRACTRECREVKWIITTGTVSKSIWCTHSVFLISSLHIIRNLAFCEGLNQNDLCIHCIGSMSSVLYDLHLFVVEQNGSGSLCYIWCSCARFFASSFFFFFFFSSFLNLAVQLQLLFYWGLLVALLGVFLRGGVGHSLFT